MIDPDRAVAQRAAQVQERGDFSGGKGAFAIFTGENGARDAAERQNTGGRQHPHVVLVQIVQDPQGLQQRMRGTCSPGQFR
ncbi:MAG: hypothetical protein ACRETD_07630 [Steroidobacteraceae bacterium]